MWQHVCVTTDILRQNGRDTCLVLIEIEGQAAIFSAAF